MDDIFKNKGNVRMSEKLRQNGWTVAAIIAGVSLLVNLYVLPMRGMEKEALQSVVNELKLLKSTVEKHEVSLTKAESWIAIGPRFTSVDAELLKTKTLDEARRTANEMDSDLRKQISTLTESQSRLEGSLRDFRERTLEVNAELKAAVNQVVAQLNTTAATFASLNGKVTDVLVKLDQVDEQKGKQP